MLNLNEKINNFHLTLYTKTGIGDGQQANNPWLQEFPDPITRTTWDNYLTVSFSDAKDLGLKNVNVSNGALNGSYANISNGSKSLKVPVICFPRNIKNYKNYVDNVKPDVVNIDYEVDPKKIASEIL